MSTEDATWLTRPLRVPPFLSSVPAGPVTVLPTRTEACQAQYKAWTDRPVTLQVVDKIGVPIVQIEATRETTMDQVRTHVVNELRKRHAHVLDAPILVEGNGHRTYTILLDVSLCTIENLADAFSGELRELQVGKRVDGCKELRHRLVWGCCCCCRYHVSAELGYVLQPPLAVPGAATEASVLPPIKSGSIDSFFADAGNRADDLEQRVSALFVAAPGSGLYPAVAAGLGIRMGSADTVPENVSGDGIVQESWDNHFAAFGEQDVERILQDYTEDSEIRVFDHRTQQKTLYTGLDGVRKCFEGLFAQLSDLSALAAPVVDVQEAARSQVFLVWSCASSGVVSATDTFTFDEAGKIRNQNVALTSVLNE